jgi:glucan phosphoethanolaminetransferase (alkaline phosphatase superfamily)
MKRIMGTPQLERLCFYIAGALYAAPTLAILAWSLRMRPPRTTAAILMTFVFTVSLIAALTRSWRRFFLWQFPIYLLGVAFATYTIAFGIPPGSTLASILTGASWEELEGFIDMPQARWSIMLLAAWSVCYLVSALMTPARPTLMRRAVLLRCILGVLLVPIAVYAASNPAELIDGIALEPIVGSVMFIGGDIPRFRAKMRDARSHKIPYLAQRSGGEEVHVLVIGESVRRDSWSAYGYGRSTTPYLDSLKNEAIFLQNAIADANLTNWSVPIMLTGLTPGVFEIGKVTENIFDLAKESGYTAVLLANQDLTIAAIAGVDAALIESPVDFSGHWNAPHTLDEQLLPAYRRKLARGGKPRFIAVHMMGSHWEYFNRYPKTFQHFGSSRQLGALSIVSLIRPNSESAVVDAYDNSVLYTDWFLQQIIEQARGLTVPATVTFFPDHGEELQLFDGRTGHGLPMYTPHAFEIPAFVWVNDAYRKLHPDIIAALRNNAAKEIRTHNVFYTVADMMGIKWPGAPKGMSFASDGFVADTTNMHIAGGVLVVRPAGRAASNVVANELASVP